MHNASVMQSHRRLVAFGLALLVTALVTPYAAFACGGCCCPMVKMPSAAAPCATPSQAGPTLTCCTRPGATEISQAPAVVTASQLETPAPSENPTAEVPPAALSVVARGGDTPSAPERARAERRHDRGLCVLNSVFRI